eukprot:scaffold128301_cov33-Phaeocystis_antarctica.AAC.1
MGGNGGRCGSSSGPGGGAADCGSVFRLIGGSGVRRGSSSGWHGAGGVGVALNRCCSARALFSSASLAFQAMPRTFSRSAQ